MQDTVDVESSSQSTRSYIVWCMGTQSRSASAGGQAAGYAAADSVQALPLVSTFWGVLLFGEYRKSSKRTYLLLAGALRIPAARVLTIV